MEEDRNEEAKKTILIVDDEKPIVDILVYNLQKEGYNTIEANDGEAGIEMAFDKRPDLILLDIMLPKVDGLTVCKKVRNSLNIPIIMISAKDEEIDKILFSKVKDLNDEEKKAIIQVMNAIHKEIDKELDNE